MKHQYVRIITKRDKLLIITSNKIIDINKNEFFKFVIKNPHIKYYLVFDNRTFEDTLTFLDDKLYSYLNSNGVIIFNKGKFLTLKEFDNKKLFRFMRKNKDAFFIRKTKNLFWIIYFNNHTIYIENATQFESIQNLEMYLELEKKLYDMLNIKYALYPQYLFSLGARASLLLRQLGVKKWFVNPKPLQLWLKQAFIGGRIETSFKGFYKGDVYYYDLNSAYLYAFSQIGNFSKIYKTKKYLPGFVGIYKVKFSLFTRFHRYNPFGIRYKERLIYPAIGTAFVTSYELEEYVKMYGWKGIKVIEGFVTKFEDYQSEKLVANIFTIRNEAKKIGLEKFFKLLGNSICGKFGSDYSKFQNLFVASLITGKVRSMLLPHICDKNNDVIHIFVDSLISLKPLNITLTNNIGGFKGFVGKNLYMLGAGRYYIEEPYTFKRLGSNTLTSQIMTMNVNNLYIQDKVIYTYRNENKILETKMVLIPKTRLVIGSKLISLPFAKLSDFVFYFNAVSMTISLMTSKVMRFIDNYKKIAKIYDKCIDETLDKLTDLSII